MIDQTQMADLHDQVAHNLGCYARRGMAGVCVCIMATSEDGTEVSILERGGVFTETYRAGLECLQARVEPSEGFYARRKHP